MIQSMTGFGRCQKTLGSRDITVEIKAVNHRYLEFSSRLPRSLGFIEDKLKAQVQSRRPGQGGGSVTVAEQKGSASRVPSMRDWRSPIWRSCGSSPGKTVSPMI